MSAVLLSGILSLEADCLLTKSLEDSVNNLTGFYLWWTVPNVNLKMKTNF